MSCACKANELKRKERITSKCFCIENKIFNIITSRSKGINILDNRNVKTFFIVLFQYFILRFLLNLYILCGFTEHDHYY